MKKILPRTVVITVLLLVSLALFVTGQKHKVFVDNKTIEISGKTYTKLPLVKVITKEKKLSIKAGRRNVFYSKGPSASIDIIYNNEDGKEVSVNKEFRIPINKDIIINIPALLQDAPGSITVYTKR